MRPSLSSLQMTSLSSQPPDGTTGTEGIPWGANRYRRPYFLTTTLDVWPIPWHPMPMRSLVRAFFRGLRAVLTPLVLLGEKLTTPSSLQRDPEEQAKVDAETQHLALYQFPACPFCVKVRKTIKRLGLNIVMHNSQGDTERRQELLSGGGRVQVPCLRITHADGQEEWMYESDDIIDYLESRFGNPATHS